MFFPTIHIFLLSLASTTGNSTSARIIPGNRDKRASIFEWLKHLKGDFYFLQETHSSLNREESWHQQWGGQLIFLHGESNSRGVAILAAKNLEMKVNAQILDNEGCFILIF